MEGALQADEGILSCLAKAEDWPLQAAFNTACHINLFSVVKDVCGGFFLFVYSCLFELITT